MQQTLNLKRLQYILILPSIPKFLDDKYMKHLTYIILFLLLCTQTACDNSNPLVNQLFFSFDQGKVWRYNYRSEFPSGGKDVVYEGVTVWTTKNCTTTGTNAQTCEVEEVFTGNRVARVAGTITEQGAYTQTKTHIFKIDNGVFTFTHDGKEYGPVNMKPKNETDDTITFGNVNSYTGEIIFKKNVGIQSWKIDVSGFGQYYRVTQTLIP